MSPKRKTTPRSDVPHRARTTREGSRRSREDLERALIIGQIAGLLVQDPDLKDKLAHKGAAVLRLVDKSQRLSRDLDSADIRGQRIEGRLIVRALSTAQAKKVVLRVVPNRPGQNSISFLVECRRFTGGASMSMRGPLLACCEERGHRPRIDNREMNVATAKAAGEPGLCSRH